MIDYVAFLNTELLTSTAHQQSGLENASLDQFYVHRDLLSHLFTWMDKNGDGTLSKEELTQSFDLINSKLKQDEQIENVAKLIDVMDIDHNGQVSYNEFLETFRMFETADIDSVRELAKRAEDHRFYPTSEIIMALEQANGDEEKAYQKLTKQSSPGKCGCAIC